MLGKGRFAWGVVGGTLESVSAEMWRQIAQQYLRGMGLENNRSWSCATSTPSILMCMRW